MDQDYLNELKNILNSPQWAKHFETVEIIPFEERKKLIGGTALSAVLGINPYVTPFQIWNLMVNDVEPSHTEFAEKKMKAGKKLEKVILEYFTEEFKPDDLIYFSKYDVSFKSKIYEFIAGTPDAICLRDNKSYIIEIKNLGYNTAKEFKDSVPVHYLCQANLYAYLFNTDYYLYAILVDGYDFQIIGPFERDNDFVNTMIQSAQDFWHNHVLKKEPPPPKSFEEVRKIYPFSQNKVVKGSPELYALCQQATQKAYLIKILQKELEDIKFEIANYMQDAEAIIYNSQPLVTFKTIYTKKLDTNKLKKDHPEIYEKYLTEVSYRKMEFINKEEEL